MAKCPNNKIFGKLRRWRRKLCRSRSARNPSIRGYNPKSLVRLCEQAIKKYKLFPEPQKKFTPPESFSVVGGKPLRKRSETLSYEKYATTSKPKKPRRRLSFTPKRLVDLCQEVIEEYNLLPQTEETLQPFSSVPQKNPRQRSSSQFVSVEKKQRGRPLGSTKNKPKKVKKVPIETQPGVALHCEVKRSRGRPPKDPLASSYNVKYSYPETSDPQLSHVRIKEEVDLPPDTDTNQEEEEEGFTVTIKEEPNSGDESNFEGPGAASPNTVLISIPPLVPSQSPQPIIKEPKVPTPGPSRIKKSPTINLMTVVLDDCQIFANRIAEQLRALPPSRALLLQLDIQNMIDNEKQLINDEN